MIYSLDNIFMKLTRISLNDLVNFESDVYNIMKGSNVLNVTLSTHSYCEIVERIDTSSLFMFKFLSENLVEIVF